MPRLFRDLWQTGMISQSQMLNEAELCQIFGSDYFFNSRMWYQSSGTNEENNLSKGMKQLKSLQERYSGKDKQGRLNEWMPEKKQDGWSESSFFWGNSIALF